MNAFSSLSLRAAGLGALTLVTAASLILGGCVTDRQIGGEGGNSVATSSGSNTTGSNTTGSNTTTGGNPTTSGTGGAGGGSDLDLINIAMLNSQITQVTDEDKSTWLDAGETLDPTTLIVVVSDHLQSCNDPVVTFNHGPETASHRGVLIGLPQSMQKVGKYDLSSTDVIAFGSSWLTDGMGSGGGVQTVLTTGTVEVLAIEAEVVNIRIEGLSGDFVPENGEYWVVRCP